MRTGTLSLLPPFQLEQLQGALYATAAAEPQPRRLVDNFRAPQELNQRLVLSSLPRGENGLGEVERAPPSPKPAPGVLVAH